MALKEFLNYLASVMKEVNIDVNRVFLQSKTKNVNIRKQILSN